ncbi:hypothetical protein Gotur_023315, partial [Gossypium turneri]
MWNSLVRSMCNSPICLTHIAVRIVTLVYALIVLCDQLESDTIAMIILLTSLITRLMIMQNIIIVTFVRKKGIQRTGFIIVKLVTLLLTWIAFLENIHSSNSGAPTMRETIHTLSLLSRNFLTTLNVLNVVNLVKIFLLNVQNQNASILLIGNAEN